VLGRVQLDARTASDWGLLRTFVQVDIRHRTGDWYGSGTSMHMGYGFGYGGGVNPNGGFPSYSGVNAYSGNIFPSVFTGPAFANYALTFPFNPILASEIAFPGAFSSFDTGQRQSTPDVVGNVRVDQGWGSAQLSGAWHRVGMQGSMINSTVLGAANSGAGTVPGGFGGKKANGWAVQGGVKVNVPYFAPGDDFWVQGA
jgi:hypothetical protein